MSSVAAQLEQAVALHRQGQVAEATNRYRAILNADPRNADAYCYLAMAACHEGRFAEGLDLARKAVAIEPGHVRAHKLIGTALQAAGRSAEALDSLDRALALDPKSADLHGLRAETLNAMRRFDEAAESYRRALDLDPNSALAHAGLGAILQEQGRDGEAMAHYSRALALDPGIAPAHHNLGWLLSQAGHHEEAVRSLQAAVRLDPDNVASQTHLGYVLQLLDRHDQAEKHFDRALALDPAFAPARWNKSLLLLALGRFAEAWPLFDARREAIAADKPRAYTVPVWDGRSREGALLVWGEYGLGDQILHASMIPDLAATMPVVLETEARLVPLFARSFPGVTVVAQQPALYSGPVARQISLASLGRYFRPDLASFPRSAYLSADPAATRRLRERLSPDGGPVIGLSWKSQRAADAGRAKSASLTEFAALLRNPAYRFVDLQYGATQDDRMAIEKEFGVRIAHLDDIDNMHDIDSLAALISACSAVVTVSNTTAHLAGALGVPTFVLVPYGHANWWYWLKTADACPWYPRVRLLHRKRGQPWAELVEAAARDIPGILAKA